MNDAPAVLERNGDFSAVPRGGTAVLVSGGVDSAAALALLLEAGESPLAITLLLPRFRADGRGWTGGGDETAPAGELCARLGVPHAVLDAREFFRAEIVRRFVDAYNGGLTPNPCVHCNPALKFGVVRRWAEEAFGIRFIATGHYAATGERGGRTLLRRFSGGERDQSYFLYRLAPDDLAGVRFPLSRFSGKPEVRAYARERGLAAADRKDSMDVCFLPGGDYRALVGGGDRPGPILDVSGNEIGRHGGVANFTLGQRRGLGRGFGKPMHVLRLLPDRNAVVIGSREDAFSRLVRAENALIHDPEVCRPGAELFARIRSGGEPAPCRVLEAGTTLRAEFPEPVFAPTPGQHLVVYDAGGFIVGGGEIRP